jgi:uncharacterized protein (UPF0332 family)
VNTEVQGWLRKARDSVRAAQALSNGGFYAEAISRAYYAMFYGAKALSVSVGQDLSKHSAVIAAFGHDFVATGKLAPHLHQYLRQGFDERNLADYRSVARPTEDDAAEQIGHAEEFLAAIEAYLISYTE